MGKSWVMMKTVLLVAFLLTAGLAAARPAPAGPNSYLNDEEDRQYAVRGVDMMMDGDLKGAVEVFQQIEQKDPDLTLGLCAGSRRDLVEDLLFFRQSD